MLEKVSVIEKKTIGEKKQHSQVYLARHWLLTWKPSVCFRWSSHRSNRNRQSACGGLKPLNYLTKFELCKTKLLDPFVFPISSFTCNRILDEFISKYRVKKLQQRRKISIKNSTLPMRKRSCPAVPGHLLLGDDTIAITTHGANFRCWI